jgi:hypothetical protein
MEFLPLTYVPIIHDKRSSDRGFSDMITGDKLNDP